MYSLYRILKTQVRRGYNFLSVSGWDFGRHAVDDDDDDDADDEDVPVQEVPGSFFRLRGVAQPQQQAPGSQELGTQGLYFDILLFQKSHLKLLQNYSLVF